MRKVSEIIKKKKLQRDYRNSHEFQAYANRLAEELEDTKHRSLYIKLAKNEDRGLLEHARTYVLEQKHAKTKGKLFMWKLAKLKQEQKDRTQKTSTLPK